MPIRWTPAEGGRLAAVLVLVACGCASPVPISKLEKDAPIEVRLDANSRAHEPGRQIKFFVDVTNRSDHVLDLADLSVEIQVHSPPGKIHLRQDWTSKWGGREMLLYPGKRITVPVVPEKGVELPIENLPEGNYDIVAVVNGRFPSRSYSLRVLRPDLNTPLRRT